VREGQFVEADSLIASLDPTDFKLALRKAGVQLKLATQDLERKKKLLRDRGISKSLVDDALAIFELRQVTFEQAAEALADAKLIAPFDGFVAKRFTDNHVNVRSGDPIIRLNDLSELFVYASIPEILFATVSAESIVSLSAKFAFAPEQSFVLEFRESTGEAESVAQTYKVTFAMKRPDGLNIMPGMTATVEVELNARANSSPGITIPITALVSNAEREFFVWLYDPVTTKVTKRLVKVGAVSGGGVPVVDGLRDGEMIVATGASHLQAGMKVRVLGEPIVGL
jgi:RND family efflux transporter MFP subunit